MSQITSGLRSILGLPMVYSAFQKLVASDRIWQRVVREHLRPQPGQRLLDVGCGPGDVVAELPLDVDYVGVDLNPLYIDSASRRFGDRATFLCADVAALPVLGQTGFDLVFAIGLLHHLDDDQAAGLCQTAAGLLKPGGRMVMVEPCRHPGQSRLERMLMDRDRGQNVRDLAGYRAVALRAFSQVEDVLDSGIYRIPWSLAILTARP